MMTSFKLHYSTIKFCSQLYDTLDLGILSKSDRKIDVRFAICRTESTMGVDTGKNSLGAYYKGAIEQLDILLREKTRNLRRLEAQRNELNTKGK